MSDAKKKESLYDIPPGCICMGDGLYGMKCNAPKHATLKHQPSYLWDPLGQMREIDPLGPDALYDDDGFLIITDE